MLRTLLAPLLLLFSSHLPAEEIPLEHCDNLLVVQVQVSGTGFFFLVDTAAVSMLNVKSFAHGEPFKAAVQSWNATIETRAQEIVIRDLAVGHHHFNNLRLTAVDLSAIGQACGRRVDGILGIDLLAQMGATLDVKKQSAHSHYRYGKLSIASDGAGAATRRLRAGIQSRRRAGLCRLS